MLELVALLDGARADAEMLELAWAACERHAPVIAALAAEARGGSDAERTAARAKLERLVELNALVQAALGAERAKLVAALAQARSARADLRGGAGSDGAGGSCDVAG
jgi:hypothetical protein